MSVPPAPDTTAPPTPLPRLAQRWARLNPLTGLTPAQFWHVARTVQATSPRRRGRGRPWRLPNPLRVLLVLVALRTNLTERALAALFGISHASAHRVIAALTPHLAALLPDPVPQDATWIVDGTLIPVHDQTVSAKSKNYRRSVNLQVLARHHDRTVITVGTAWPGNRNDIVVVKETLADILAAAAGAVLGDGGYRSHPNITIPPPRDQPDARAAHITARARVEHVLARLKDWQILRQCRRKGDAINQITKAVAYLHNLKQLRFIS